MVTAGEEWKEGVKKENKHHRQCIYSISFQFVFIFEINRLCSSQTISTGRKKQNNGKYRLFEWDVISYPYLKSKINGKLFLSRVLIDVLVLYEMLQDFSKTIRYFLISKVCWNVSNLILILIIEFKTSWYTHECALVPIWKDLRLFSQYVFVTRLPIDGWFFSKMDWLLTYA